MCRDTQRNAEKNRQTDKRSEEFRDTEVWREVKAPESTPKKQGDRGTEKPRGLRNP